MFEQIFSPDLLQGGQKIRVVRLGIKPELSHLVSLLTSFEGEIASRRNYVGYCVLHIPGAPEVTYNKDTRKWSVEGWSGTEVYVIG